MVNQMDGGSNSFFGKGFKSAVANGSVFGLTRA